MEDAFCHLAHALYAKDIGVFTYVLTHTGQESLCGVWRDANLKIEKEGGNCVSVRWGGDHRISISWGEGGTRLSLISGRTVEGCLLRLNPAARIDSSVDGLLVEVLCGWARKEFGSAVAITF